MKAGLMLGVNPETEREVNDFYATDPYAIYKMKDMFIECGLDNNVWECACGNGNLCEPLKKLGYNVVATDLVKRNYDCEQLDFLKCNKTWNGDILTNPPFKLAKEFVKKSMTLLSEGHKAWMFLKVQFLETPSRAELFKSQGLKYVIVNSERICCAKNDEFDNYFKKDKSTGVYKGGTQLYCWFVFEKDYKDDPVIKFV